MVLLYIRKMVKWFFKANNTQKFKSLNSFQRQKAMNANVFHIQIYEQVKLFPQAFFPTCTSTSTQENLKCSQNFSKESESKIAKQIVRRCERMEKYLFKFNLRSTARFYFKTFDLVGLFVLL